MCITILCFSDIYIYLIFGCAESSLLQALSLAVVSRSYSPVAACWLLLAVDVFLIKKILSNLIYIWLCWIFIAAWIFLYLQRIGTIPASHYGSFFCGGAWASIVVAPGL